MYNYDERPNTVLASQSEPALRAMHVSEYSVLVGRNNSGKSFVLKTLAQEWGEKSSYLGPARYQNFNLLGYYSLDRNRRSQRHRQFLDLWRNNQQNFDNSPMNLQQAIAELSDHQRESLAEIMKNLLGVELEIRQVVPENSMSQRYVSCDGHNMSYTSSGIRLITSIVTSLLDSSYDRFLVDEPELGISPEAQAILANFLFNNEQRKRYFSHIKNLVLATHSTIFLDRARIWNNYSVQKSGDEIIISQIKTQADFNGIHFLLLGNRFETLYLPSAIVLVEGKSDFLFVERVVKTRYPESQISVLSANSDSRIREILHIAKGLLANIQRSPYRDRIFVLLDAVHGAGLPEQLVSMGIDRANIIKWPQNGIEYYYPPLLLGRVFGSGGELTIEGDIVSRNGLAFSKTELADKIIAMLQSDTEMNSEFEQMFLTKLKDKAVY